MPHIESVRQARTKEFLKKDNVVGVGIGYKETNGETTDKQALVVMVQKKMPFTQLAPGAAVPRYVDGVVTDVIEVGHIRALGYSERMRPMQPGVSIGHYRITAGTFGAVAHTPGGKAVILSNNHVLANTNDAAPGDPIYQPGPIDGGNEDDIVGYLEKFYPIKFGEEPPPDVPCNLAMTYANIGNALAKALGRKSRVVAAVIYEPTADAENYIDAAIAMPASPDIMKSDILDIGLVEGTELGTLGMAVQKTGRTTGHTKGSIKLVNASVYVDYGLSEPALFVDQLITGYMSRGGDSGSLLVTDEPNPKAVGLLFAGSSSSTIYNPIETVLQKMQITL